MNITDLFNVLQSKGQHTVRTSMGISTNKKTQWKLAFGTKWGYLIEIKRNNEVSATSIL